jgi:hypothetical protein
MTFVYQPVSTYGYTALLDGQAEFNRRLVTWYSFTIPPLNNFAGNDVACHRFIDREQFAFFIGSQNAIPARRFAS